MGVLVNISFSLLAVESVFPILWVFEQISHTINYERYQYSKTYCSYVHWIQIPRDLHSGEMSVKFFACHKMYSNFTQELIVSHLLYMAHHLILINTCFAHPWQDPTVYSYPFIHACCTLPSSSSLPRAGCCILGADLSSFSPWANPDFSKMNNQKSTARQQTMLQSIWLLLTWLQPEMSGTLMAAKGW